MRVKMKVKHLVIFLLAVLSCVFIFVIFAQPKLESFLIHNQVASGEKETAKAIILEKIENGDPEKLELIREYMIEPQPEGNRYDVYIGSSMSTWGPKRSDQLFSLEESEPFLEIYVKEASSDGYLKRAITILKTYYESNGNIEAAEKVLSEGIERFSNQDFNYRELQLMRIELAINSKNFEQSEQLINDYKENMDETITDANFRLSKLMTERLVLKGQYDEAYHFINEEIEKYQQWHEQFVAEFAEDDGFMEGFSGSPYFNALVRLHSQLEGIVNDPQPLAKVEGKVMKSNGEPLQHVGVFLREESATNHSVTQEDQLVVTSADGSFSFQGVIPGSYQIHVGFMYEQIDGWAWPVETDEWLDIKAGETIEYPVVVTPLIEAIEPADYEVITDQEITFAWEEFPNAASYELIGNLIFDGSSVGVQILPSIKETKVTIPVEDLYALRTGTLYTGDDGTGIEPGSILGFANVEGTFAWAVKAYDEEGELVGQSNGYRLREETMGSLPFFHLKERELTEADRAFLNTGDSESALEMYKQNVKKDPDDVHSLRMITRLIGFDHNKEEGSRHYWLALAKKDPTANTLFEVARIYYEKENWVEFERWYNRYLEITPGNSYTKSFYASALMRQGKLAESRTQFYEVMEEDRSNRFVGFLLAIELYLQDDWKKVESIAKKYKERGQNSTEWLLLIHRLQKEANKEDVKEALNIFFTGDKRELEQKGKNLNNEALTNLIQKLENVR